jgi:hypothetical protein
MTSRGSRYALNSADPVVSRLAPTRVERHEPAPPMAGGHIVMQDSEGNEFCLD